jgi:signal peptidase I
MQIERQVLSRHGNITVAKKELTVENNVAADKEKRKDPAAMGKTKADAEEKPKETTVEFLSSLAAVLVTGLFIITFVVQAFEIPSSSMENTLLIGDHVFVNRIQFAPKSSWVGPVLPYRDVRFRDIVVFLSPQTPGLYVVKRIIGVPGDRIHLRNGVVYRNGVALEEPYVDHDDDRPDSYRNDFPSVPPPPEDGNIWDTWAADLPSHIQGDDIIVPPDHYFGMGDHRGVSLDSRYWGFIPKDNIIGRPMFIYWSFVTPGDQYLKTSGGERVQFFLGQVVLHFFDKTRWRRTLQVVR